MSHRVRCLSLALALSLGSEVSAQQPWIRPAPQRPRPASPRPVAPRSARPDTVVPGLEVNLGDAAPFVVRTEVPVPKPQEVTPQIESKPVAQPEQPAPAPETPQLVLAPVNWRRDFESTQRRPIETAIFGKGPQRVAVIANVAGNSEGSIAVVDQLAGLLARQEVMPANLSVMVVRNPNPDGTFLRTLTNSRGVDLNRNFPTTRFTSNPSRETGDRPGSEAETRALMQLLNQFNPERVIHVVESRSTRGTVRSDDILPHEIMTQYDAAPFDGVYKLGSLAGYVHQTLKRSVIEVELPQESISEIQQDDLVQLAVTVLDQTARNVRAKFVPRNDLAEEPGLARRTSQPQTDGVRGDVEFLPPPPDASPVPDKPRYIELPPPPE